MDIFRKNYIDSVDRYNGEDFTISSFAHCSKSEANFNPEMIQIAAKTGVEEWIVNLPWYYETKNHIFVHGWLPEYFREASDREWDEASWSNTQHEINCMLKPYEKTLVFGHWSTSLLRGESIFNGDYSTWFNDRLKLVGLDNTTAAHHEIQMYVIEDEPIA